MKRSFGSLESVPEAGEPAAVSQAPKLKRAQTENIVGSHRLSEVAAGKDGILKLQNRALNIELSKKKREIERLRRELDDAVAKERIKEAEFVAANTVLAELDNCVRTLLSASGGVDAGSSTEGARDQTVEGFLSLGRHPLVESVDLRPLHMDVDDWSTPEAYSEAVIGKSAAEMSSEFRKLLSDRVLFLQNALEKLSVAAGIPMSAFNSSCASLLKSSESEKLTLQVELGRLKSSLQEVGQRLFESEKRRRKAERDLDTTTHSLIDKAEGRIDPLGDNDVSTPLNGPSQDVAAATSTTETLPSNQSVGNHDVCDEGKLEISADMGRKLDAAQAEVDVLTKQLSEAESGRVEAENKLSEVLASEREEVPAGETEDILQAIKQKFTEKVALLQSEIANLRAKNDAANAAVARIEKTTTVQIETISATTKDEITKLSSELEESEKNRLLLDVDNKGLRDVKLQASELLITVDALRVECNALRDQKKKLVAAIERLELHLSQSRAREVAAGGPLSKEDGVALILARESDITAELEDAKAQMSDLFIEIETVANSEEKTREQCARVQQQMADNRQIQQTALEENLKLQQEARTLKSKLKETDTRCASALVLNTQLEGLLGQMKHNESELYANNARAKQTITDSESKIKSLEAELLEAESKRAAASDRYEALKKRSAALSDRITATTTEIQAERKKRMKFEALVKKEHQPAGDTPRMKRSASASSVTSQNDSGEHDVQLGKVALDLLRCSVCTDRFKSVAITRCLHMFCKECIDENLRNRQRKCPACGEKFGQDDVRQVFFNS